MLIVDDAETLSTAEFENCKAIGIQDKLHVAMITPAGYCKPAGDVKIFDFAAPTL